MAKKVFNNNRFIRILFKCKCWFSFLFYFLLLISFPSFIYYIQETRFICSYLSLGTTSIEATFFFVMLVFFIYQTSDWVILMSEQKNTTTKEHLPTTIKLFLSYYEPIIFMRKLFYVIFCVCFEGVQKQTLREEKMYWIDKVMYLL